MSPKHNFKEMSLSQLKRYILSHRDDQEAWEEFASRERPNAIYFNTDISLDSQTEQLQELLQNDY